MTSEEDRGIAEKRIDNVQAYDCYLRARHEYSRMTREGIEAALRYLDEGLAIVGPNALLYAAKGRAYLNLAIIDTDRHHELLETCREWAEKVFELEPDSARGHGLLGFVLHDFFETVEGIRHMERAYELDPNDFDNLIFLCGAYGWSVGRHEKTSSFVARLVELDGMNPFSQWMAASCTLYMDRVDEAERLFEKAYALDPEAPNNPAYAEMLASRGDTNEAIEILTPFENASMSHAWITLGLILKYALEKNRAKATELITEELEARCPTDLLYAWKLAERYVLLGEKEKALSWLEVAIEGGFWNYGFLKLDPLLRDLQGEPELDRLIELAREKSKQLDV